MNLVTLWLINQQTGPAQGNSATATTLTITRTGQVLHLDTKTQFVEQHCIDSSSNQEHGLGAKQKKTIITQPPYPYIETGMENALGPEHRTYHWDLHPGALMIIKPSPLLSTSVECVLLVLPAIPSQGPYNQNNKCF